MDDMTKKQQKTLPAYKPQEAADYIGVSITTIRTWRLNGTLKLTSTRGGTELFTAESVEALRDERDKLKAKRDRSSGAAS